MSLIKLFLIYLKIGAILVGGGYVILPVMMHEFVDKRKLVTNDEMINYFALAQSLPGIIAANMSIFIGYKLRGKWGAVTAVLGLIFVPFWTIIFLGAILSSLTGNVWIQAVLWGVGIGVIAMIILTARETWRSSERNMFYYVIFLLSLTSLLILKISPISTIIIFSVLSVFIKFIQRRIQK